MLKYLKFGMGNELCGYKTVKVDCSSEGIAYEILRSGLLTISKGIHQRDDVVEWLNEWETLCVSSWDEIYTGVGEDCPVEWRLTVQEDDLTYKCGGSGAYPMEWNAFLEWLDALMPEMEFIAPDRIECISLNYENPDMGDTSLTERIRIDRREQKISAEKDMICFGDASCNRRSSHTYEIGDKVCDVLDIIQACDFAEDIAVRRGKPEVSIRISRHALPDIYVGNVIAWIDETGDECWERAINSIKSLMPDLRMELLSFKTYAHPTLHGKFIFCKVRFGTSFKLYSYRTEDTTLEVGDVVKVPVGKDNDIGYATIEEIGYYNEDDAPYPVDKAKFIIGLHYKKGE